MSQIPPFNNEALTDFTRPENREAMEAALKLVRGELGREYDLRIGGERLRTTEKLRSTNPSRPDEVVGVFSKATPEQTEKAVQVANQTFATWQRVPAATRTDILFRAAAIMRRRKHELSAWMVHEVGKTWPEADADTSEAIDFCDYYARECLRICGADDSRVTP